MKKIIKKILQRKSPKNNIQCAHQDYSWWIEKTEKPRQSNVVSWKKLFYQPSISIVVSCANTNEHYFKQCIASVLSQSYPHWTLYLVTEAFVPDYIRAYIGQDERIQLVSKFFPQGDYFTSLGSWDLLTKHALMRVVQAINKSGEACLLYSDEDSLDAENKRFSPQFKPDWNLDLFLSHNYIARLAVIKTTLFDAYAKIECNQEYDLMLHCIAKLQGENIVHIPEILYHRRSMPGLPSQSGNNNTGAESLKKYCQLITLDAKVERGLLDQTYRVRWPIPKNKPLVSLLIPTRDSYHILKICIDSILNKTSYDNFEILILSNQTRCSETLQYMRSIALDKRVSVHHWDEKFNYAAINNFGAKKAQGTILGLLNNDVEVINSGWLNEMVSQAYRQEIGCVGAKLYYPNNTVQHAGVVLGIGGVADHVHKRFKRDCAGYTRRLKVVQNFSAVTGACLVMRKSLFEQVSGLDEENLAITYNDVDLCLKVRELGFRNIWTPYAELYHHESFSRGKNNTREKKMRARSEQEYMQKRWGKALKSDPAYNPNLSLVCNDFSIKI